jgi:hypothetical protein
MAMLANPAAPPLERIRQNLVGLRMPRALEILDAVVSRLERGEITALEAIDVLLAEELIPNPDGRDSRGGFPDAGVM